MRKVAKVLLAVLAAGATASAIILAVRCHKNRCKYGGCGCDDMIPPTPEEKLYVLTNEDKLNGAAIVLNDKVMDDITEKLGQDFYILPSSVRVYL